MANFNDTQMPDPRSGFYYVTVRRRQADARLLRGPFSEHTVALAAVRDSMTIARRLDPKSEWYSFGTSRSETNLGPGILDRLKL